MAKDPEDPGTGDFFAYSDPLHVIQQRASLLVGRMKDGTASKTDLQRYADAYRTLKRAGVEIPKHWPAPAIKRPKTGFDPQP